MKRKSTTRQYISISTWKTGVFCLLCLFSFSNPAVGGDLSTTTSITIKQAYNDNIFLVDEDPEIRLRPAATGPGQPQTNTKSSDFITTISPGIAVKHEGPRTTISISGRLDFLRYADLSDLNDVSHFYNGLFRYQLNPYTRLTLDGSYIRDSDPGSETDITGLNYGTDVRHRQNYGAGLEFDLSELSLIRLNYRYSQDDFSKSSLGTDDTDARRRQREANDSKTHHASIFYTRDISDLIERTFIYSNMRYLNYNTTNTEQNNISMVMGGGYQLSETISLKADAGMRYSHEKSNRIQRRQLTLPPFYEYTIVEQRRGEWGPAGHAQIEYQGLWTWVRLKYSHDVQAASGMETMTRLTEVRLDASRRFGEFFTITGFNSYFLHAGHEVDEKTLNLGMTINYELSQYFSLTGKYTHTRKREELGQREQWVLPDAGRNMFFVSLTYKYSF